MSEFGSFAIQSTLQAMSPKIVSNVGSISDNRDDATTVAGGIDPMATSSDIVAAVTRDIEMSRICPIPTSPVSGPMDVDGGLPKIEDGHLPLQSAGETSCVNRIHPNQPI